MVKRRGVSKKGKSFEKEIAKELSFWWSDGERDDIFYCTHGSGSRFTARKKQGKDTANSCGDIGLIDPKGQPFLSLFMIEIKRGYSQELDILSIVDGNKKNHELLTWIEKAIKETKDSKRQSFIIIFKRDFKNKAVCVRRNFMQKFSKFHEPFQGKELQLFYKPFTVCIVDYIDFFSWLEPSLVKQYNDKINRNT